MTMRITCGCGAAFHVTSNTVGGRVRCPTCGKTGPVPEPNMVVLEHDDECYYSPCSHCGTVQTVNGILCMRCAYEMQTGRKLQAAGYRWVAMTATMAAAAVVLLVILWAGISLLGH